MALEFRVRWRREGQHRDNSQIFQSWEAAYAKMQRIAAIEAVKAESERFRDMPDLVRDSLRVESRRCEEWGRHPIQPLPPGPIKIDDVRAWACTPAASAATDGSF